LLMWIHEHLEDVVLINETVVGKGREISLGKNAISHAGFEDDEALLPFGRMSFPGFRLLEEYYVLPQKFAFIDVAGLARAADLDKQTTTFILALRFNTPWKDAPAMMSESVKPHCVPLVTIFDTSAEPIRLDAAREQFLVRPAGLPPGHAEVYAIGRVETIPTGTTERVEIPSFYEFSHAENSTDPTRT